MHPNTWGLLNPFITSSVEIPFPISLLEFSFPWSWMVVCLSNVLPSWQQKPINSSVDLLVQSRSYICPLHLQFSLSKSILLRFIPTCCLMPNSFTLKRTLWVYCYKNPVHYDPALAQEQWRTGAWILKPWSSRRIRFWVHRTNLFNPWIHKGLYLNPQAQEHSQNRRTLRGEKAKLSIRNNFKLWPQVLQWGALYRPQKVKGRPSDMTPW